jgi:hypothetical protein
VRTRFSVLVRKCVLPIHDLKVPKGCSTVCRRRPMAFGIRSSLACIASRTHSCFQRLIRFSLSGVRLGLVDVAAAVRSDKPSRQVLAGRAGVMVLLGVVDEILPGEEAALGAARCQCLCHTGQHAGVLACQYLIAVEIAAISQNSDLLVSRRLLCRVSDTGRLMIYRPVVMAGVRKPSGKEPAGGGVGGVLSMGICRGSVLGRGCTGRRNGRRTDDRGRDFVAAPAVGGVFLA